MFPPPSVSQPGCGDLLSGESVGETSATPGSRVPGHSVRTVTVLLLTEVSRPEQFSASERRDPWCRMDSAPVIPSPGRDRVVATLSVPESGCWESGLRVLTRVGGEGGAEQ